MGSKVVLTNRTSDAAGISVTRTRRAVDEREPRAWIESQLLALADGVEVERWVTRADALDGGGEVAATELMRRRFGVEEPRAALRLLGAWLTGPAATAVAAITARECVGLDLAASGGVELGLAPEGYPVALRIEEPSLIVLPHHPWAGRRHVSVAPDEEQLRSRTVAGLVRWCAPIVEALDPGGKGRPPLWAQVGDSIGYTALRLRAADPASDPDAWIAAVQQLLEVRDAPWRQAPLLWTAEDVDDTVILYRRGSCCLFYRAGEPEEPIEEADADYLACFGDDGPRYCTTCRLRDQDDVQERLLYWARRERDGTAALAAQPL